MSINCVDNELIDVTGICKPSTFTNLTTFNYWTEISIPEMVIVPDVKPAIEQINSINVGVEIIRKKVVKTPFDNTTTTPADALNYEGKKVTGRKLIVEGLLCNTISYTADKPDQSLHTTHAKIPFSAYIVVPYQYGSPLTDTMLANFDVIPCVEDVFVKNFCGKQIFINVTLFLQAVINKKTCQEICECDDLTIIKGICPEDRIKDFLSIPPVTPGGTKTLNRNWTELFVPEILNVPTKKPDIEQIISVSSRLEIISDRIIESPVAVENNEGVILTGRKLVVEAILRQKVVYTANNPEQSVHSAHFDVPFSAFIVLDSAALLTSKYKLDACIEDIFICALNERQIFKNVTLFIKATPLIC